MARRIQMWLLLLSMLVVATQINAVPPAALQDEDIPLNGCLIYNKNNVAVTFKLRNMSTGAWEQNSLAQGTVKPFILKDGIQFQGNVQRLEFYRKYYIVWNSQRGVWDLQPG